MREVQPNGQVLVPLVPSSCCRVMSSDCGHLAWLQANRSWAGLRPVDSSLLYTDGCAPAIARIFAIDLMLCRLLVLAVAALQVNNIIIFFRYPLLKIITSLAKPIDVVGFFIHQLQKKIRIINTYLLLFYQFKTDDNAFLNYVKFFNLIVF